MKLSDNKLVCAHCKSLNIIFYGATYGGYHYYYKCLDCFKYTERYCSLKNMRIILFVIFLNLAVVIAVFNFLLDFKSDLAISYSFATTFLLAIFYYKYRWSGFETIVRDNLPNDRWIIHVSSKRIRLIARVIVSIFVAAFIAYVAIFFLNLAGQ
jgi:hypothetical protein